MRLARLKGHIIDVHIKITNSKVLFQNFLIWIRFSSTQRREQKSERDVNKTILGKTNLNYCLQTKKFAMYFEYS